MLSYLVPCAALIIHELIEIYCKCSAVRGETKIKERARVLKNKLRREKYIGDDNT
jgi:hypothetical protein